MWTWGNPASATSVLGRTTTGPEDTFAPGPVDRFLINPAIWIGAGSNHMLAVQSDGSVWSWGNGYMGNGTTSGSAVPVQVSGLSGATAVSGGGSWSLALKSDGTVWAWGENGGRLGDGTTTARPSPVPVTGLTGITGISAGRFHGLARRSDGTVWAWGINSSGQVGDGTTATRTVPIQIAGLSDVIAVAAGDFHSLALKSDGTLRAWGSNIYFQLGVGSDRTSRLSPVQVNLTNVAQIVAGEAHSMAVKHDGTLWAWGVSPSGQLGTGDTLSQTTPAAVVLGDYVPQEIAAGTRHSMAVGTDGTIMSWGSDSYGQLGAGAGRLRTTPEQVVGLSGVTAIDGGTQHVAAVTSDGALWTWGASRNGSLGQGTAAFDRAVPAVVSGLLGVRGVSAGLDYTLALKGDGTVWSFGLNNRGNLGDGTAVPRGTPVQADGLSGVEEVSAGAAHSLARKSDGSVWSWGDNTAGQLGGGGGTGSMVAAPMQIPGLGGVLSVAAGTDHSLAAKGDGSVWSWGSNDAGQLGTGGAAFGSPSPVQVAGLSGIVKVCSSGDASFALESDGSLWAWGDNSYGQLGDGTTTSRDTPVEVLLSGVVALKSLANRTFAVTEDGSTWAWGYNANGELGDGTATHRPTPVQVQNASGCVITAGTEYVSFALKEDGALLAWGVTSVGEAGDGSLGYRTTPSPVLGVHRDALSPSLSITPADLTVVPLGSTAPVGGTFALGNAPIETVSYYARRLFLGEDSVPPFSYAYSPESWGDLEINVVGTDTLASTSKPKSIRLRTPYDHDVDLMPDWIEVTHFGTISAAPGGDADGDGLSNSAELAVGLSPSDPDFDGDGIPDGTDPDPLHAASLTNSATALKVWTRLE